MWSHDLRTFMSIIGHAELLCRKYEFSAVKPHLLSLLFMNPEKSRSFSILRRATRRRRSIWRASSCTSVSCWQFISFKNTVFAFVRQNIARRVRKSDGMRMRGFPWRVPVVPAGLVYFFTREENSTLWDMHRWNLLDEFCLCLPRETRLRKIRTL